MASIRRFPSGLSHYVFDVVTNDTFPYVVRIARPERRTELERGIYWHKRLEDTGIPLPEIYYTGEVDHHSYAVYERLPGSDLEDVYPFLSMQEKKSIAYTIAEIQQKVHSLEQHHFETIYPWVDVIRTIVKRSERDILAARPNTPQKRFIDHVREKIEENMGYLCAVEPVAFLYDLNVRNVIIQDGIVSGIIDVDALWYGDPLLAIGRGKTILLIMRQDCDFVDYWCQFLGLSTRQLQMVDFYALLYSVRFMGTIGQTLNGNVSPQTDPSISPLLEKIANDMLDNLERPAV